jgi:hypothetical protein
LVWGVDLTKTTAMEEGRKKCIALFIFYYILYLKVSFLMQAMQNIMSSTCITFRPTVAADLDWMSIITTGVSGCFANTQ